jgi:hypothetical protein
MSQSTRVQITKTPSTLHQDRQALFSKVTKTKTKTNTKTKTPVLPLTRITLSDVSAESHKIA